MADFLPRLTEFIGHHPLLAFGLFGVLLALAFVEAQRLRRGYTAVTPAGLTQLINREDALLIDLSSQQDFEKGHIPGAKQVSMSQFDPESKELIKIKEQPVAVVCKNGQVSGKAAQRLKKAGFTKVFWLEGGLGAWNEAHMPLAKGRG
ncbi:MAG: rhodanese-like domain-containing protein [Dokdonella sp.]